MVRWRGRKWRGSGGGRVGDIVVVVVVRGVNGEM
jgi:hypothetical protein